MKNHLAGFGLIMLVGLALALVGSNPASTALASLLTITTNTIVTQTSATTTATSSGAISTQEQGNSTTTEPTPDSILSATTKESMTNGTASTTASTEGSTSVEVTQTQESVTIVHPSIIGIQNGEVVAGTRSAAVKVFGMPIAVQAELRLPSGVINPIYPQCPETASTIYSGATSGENCLFTIDTRGLANGVGYQVRGLAKYANGSLLTTGLVQFAVANETVPSGFIFMTPAAQTTLSGLIQVQGKIDNASAVRYVIFDRNDESTVILRGTAEHVGDIWLYQWDTQAITNGSYVIVPEIVDRQGVLHRGISRSVIVRNEPIITDTAPIIIQPTLVDPTTSQVTAPEVTVIPLPIQAPESAKIPEPAIAEQKGDGVGMSIPAFQPTEVPKPVNVGFFQNIRDTLRSAITPREEAPKPVIITSEAVQKLEQVSSELSEEVTAQSALDRITKDSDGDGISDFQETEVVRTDPRKRDTDGDGVEDGTEVRQGTNPLNADRTVKIQYENAKLLGETVKPELLKIEMVTLATTTEIVEVDIATTTESGETKTIKEKKRVTKEKIRLAGKTLPHALVTLYVYSDIPTIVTVKADKSGNWSYALEKPLDDGQHQAYVTINDSEGRIVAKSQALGFIKTAQAITIANIEELAQAAENEKPAPVEESKRNFGIIVALVIVLGLLTGVLMVVRSFRNAGSDTV